MKYLIIALLMFASTVFAQETMDKTCDVKQDLIELLEEYIKTLPEKEMDYADGIYLVHGIVKEPATLEGFLEWLKRK